MYSTFKGGRAQMSQPMDRSKRVFGKLTEFERVFPNVDSALVEYIEIKRAATSIEPQPHYHEMHHGGLIACGNPRCKRGGYEMEGSLYTMSKNNETEMTGERSCPGDEGSPKGRKKGRACGNSIKFKITVKYKSSDR
jgi:hypothetical protein